MESKQFFKTDKGFINPDKIRWMILDANKECFEICLKSTGCKSLEEEKDTWSVCKLVSKDSYETLVKKIPS